MKNLNRPKNAFTLAEVLITLGVIGVVAAITMPTLIANYKEKATVTAVKKAYSQISQAYQYLSMENGLISEWADWENEGPDKMAELFCTRLKCLKVCSADDESCSPEKIFNTREDRAANKSRTPTQYFGGIYSYAILEDGTTLAFHPTQIEVDINGFKAPNTPSLDMFIFTVENNKIYPRGINNDNPVQSFDNYCLRYGHACAAWVLTNENTDYLKCPEKLSWNGKHSCKD